MKLKQAVTLGFLVITSVLCVVASAQQVIKVSEFSWLTLTSSERDLIQKSYVVSMASNSTFGVIIDNQEVNESTSGINGGAALGGAIANAAYVDNAIRGGNYSAVNQLAIGILGSVVESTLDNRAKTQYHHRYAVKFSNGDIKYFDEISSDAFRHPLGVCVSVPNIALTDQQLCSQTGDSLRINYLRQLIVPSTKQPIDPLKKTASVAIVSTTIQANTENSPTIINCKLGTLAPVRTSPEKCALIKGSQVQ